MEMQINSQLVRSEREKRAWSQSHLASVCGLGLRTVQRIEASGSASYESAAAIATAFSLTVAALRATGNVESKAADGSRPAQGQVRTFSRVDWLPRAKTVVGLSVGAVAMFLAVFGSFYYRAVSAEPLTVDFGVVRNGDEPYMGGTLPGNRGGFGRDDLVVKIKSTMLNDGSVMLRARIYECEGEDEGKNDDLRLLSDSEVTTAVGSTAEIRFSSVVSGHEYTIQLTPHPG
jgi:transcriptional regulator with XRE-family HTH domain